jgi:hypothetical protein
MYSVDDAMSLSSSQQRNLQTGGMNGPIVWRMSMMSRKICMVVVLPVLDAVDQVFNTMGPSRGRRDRNSRLAFNDIREQRARDVSGLTVGVVGVLAVGDDGVELIQALTDGNDDVQCGEE